MTRRRIEERVEEDPRDTIFFILFLILWMSLPLGLLILFTRGLYGY
jgi:hypothetical protein